MTVCTTGNSFLYYRQLFLYYRQLLLYYKERKTSAALTRLTAVARMDMTVMDKQQRKATMYSRPISDLRIYNIKKIKK